MVTTNIHYKRRLLILMVGVLLLLSLQPLVSASWNNNSFYNGTNYNTIENITFTGASNITRNLSVPNVFVSSGVLNLSGFNSTYFPTNLSLFIGDSLIQRFAGSNVLQNFTQAHNQVMPAGSTGAGSYYGVIITANKNGKLTSINGYPDGATSCKLMNGDGSSQLASGTVTNNICPVNYDLVAGSTYQLTMAGSSAAPAISGAPFPIVNDYVTWINGVDAGGGNLSGYIVYVGNITIQDSVGTDTFTQINNRTSISTISINNYLSSCTYSGGFCQVPFIFHSDTAGILQYSDLNFSGTEIQINNVTYNSSTYETSSENFILNVSGTGAALTANLVYDGVSYAATKTGTNVNAIFTKSLSIPLVSTATNKSFYWEIFLDTTPTNSSTYIQTVNPIYFLLCNSTINTTYLNYTFKYEDTNADTNGSITSSFVYYLGNGVVTKSYSYQSTTDTNSYGFCFTPNTSPIYITPSVQYSNFDSVIKTYNYPSAIILSSTPTNTVLYLTKTVNGIYSSYQVTTQSLTVLPNALVTFTLNGNVIESRLTDGSGIATFFLNPNTAYTLTASKTGYASFTTTIYPTQSTYSIALAAIGSGNVTSYTPCSCLCCKNS